jgi:hypothetical protein
MIFIHGGNRPDSKPMFMIFRFFRFCAKLRFRALSLATIKDIPTEKFNRLIKTLIDDGWKKTHEYVGFDAWIDYGRIDLRKKNRRLKFEWDNWTEGSVEGPREIVEIIGKESAMPISFEWRWTSYDRGNDKQVSQ